MQYSNLKSGMFLDDIFFAVVRIVTSDPLTGISAVGTGFLYSTWTNTEGSVESILLISNRHVLSNGHSRITLIFNKRSDDTTKPDLGNTVTFTDDNLKEQIIDHPDPEIDLACLPVTGIKGSEHQVFCTVANDALTSIPDSMIVHAGKEVFFIGYPDNRFDAVHNLPILRRGYIASLPDIDFNGKPQFVIDAQVFPGSSGSPVFIESSGAFRLFGVVTATMVKDEQLKPISVNTVASSFFGVQQTIGLGLVIKVKPLTELISFAKEKIEQESKRLKFITRRKRQR